MEGKIIPTEVQEGCYERSKMITDDPRFSLSDLLFTASKRDFDPQGAIVVLDEKGAEDLNSSHEAHRVGTTVSCGEYEIVTRQTDPHFVKSHVGERGQTCGFHVNTAKLLQEEKSSMLWGMIKCVTVHCFTVDADAKVFRFPHHYDTEN